MNTPRTLYTLALALLLSMVAPAYAAEGAVYATLQDAATAALSEAEALTDSYEAGGTVYACTKGYVYVRPTTDNKRTSLAVSVYQFEGCTLAGLYHTHPKGDHVFSVTDVKGSCALRVPSFMKPRNSAIIRMIDCSTMTEPAIRVATSGSRPVMGDVL